MCSKNVEFLEHMQIHSSKCKIDSETQFLFFMLQRPEVILSYGARISETIILLRIHKN